MFKMPIRLRAEPRLWGAVVLDHPKNPPEWRGKGFAMSSLLGQATTAVASVSDGEGNPLRADGRSIVLAWPDTRSGRLFAEAKRRWLGRRLSDGTLDIACGSRTARRDEAGIAIFCGVLLAVLAALVVWMFIGGVLRTPPPQRTWVDWLVAIGACVLLLGLPAILTALLLKGLRRTCCAYRLTADRLTPVDGPLAGKAHSLREVSDYGSYGLNLVRLRIADATLLVSPPPLPIEKLLGREEEEKRRNRSLARRIIGILITGVVLASIAGVLTQPITGLAPWKPALALLAMVPAALINLYGPRWMYRWIATRERRSKQRQNRLAAAAGRTR